MASAKLARLARHPQDIARAAVVKGAGEDEEVIGKAVKIGQGRRIDRFLCGQRSGRPLCPAHRCARQMHARCRVGTARKDKTGKGG